jgi:Ca2+-binding EF-hand superfamily protein
VLQELESIVFAYDISGDGTIQYSDLLTAMQSAKLVDASGAVISANL